jgi:hypothetical protein
MRTAKIPEDEKRRKRDAVAENSVPRALLTKVVVPVHSSDSDASTLTKARSWKKMFLEFYGLPYFIKSHIISEFLCTVAFYFGKIPKYVLVLRLLTISGIVAL